MVVVGGGGGGFGPGFVGRRLFQAPCKTALEVMQSTPELSSLAALVPSLTPKLREALSSPSGAPFTFFAPSNAALSSLAAALPDFAPELRNGTVLTALLSYHIVPGKLLASDALQGAPLATALGGMVPPLSAAGATLKGVGSEAAVVKPDLRSCHATLHVVNNVLLPIPLPGGARLPLPAAAEQEQTTKSQEQQ